MRGKPVDTIERRNKIERFDIRTTREDLFLIDRAAEQAGLDRTAYVTLQMRQAALRTLAESSVFAMSADQAEALDAILDAPARDLPSLRRFLEQPSPFSDR